MAVHDAVYATQPTTWAQFWARMQHIAEEAVGVAARKAMAHEDDVMKQLQGL